MGLDRGLREAKAPSQPRVAQALPEQPQHFDFARGQGGQVRCGSGAAADSGR